VLEQRERDRALRVAQSDSLALREVDGGCPVGADDVEDGFRWFGAVIASSAG
jgi:hypothetical protein